jgi:hypothetical protein
MPDLVPLTWPTSGGKIGAMHFSCETWTGNIKVLQIMVVIKNIGTAATTVPVKTHVKINGFCWDEPCTFLAQAGMVPHQEKLFLKASWVANPGTYTLWVKVDSENAQKELNETNNEATATATCN